MPQDIVFASIKEPVRYVSVYRVEHTGCSMNPHHGPNIGRCMNFGDRPEFGVAGPDPYSEGLPMNQYKHCGLLDEQVDLWWGPYLFGGCYLHEDEVDNSDIERVLPPHWNFVEYRLPDWAVESARWQCVFEPQHAIDCHIVSADWLARHGIHKQEEMQVAA